MGRCPPTSSALPLTPDLVHGALELEPTEGGGLRRTGSPPGPAAQNADEMLAINEAQPSGVRRRRPHRATVVELDAVVTRRALRGAPARPSGSVDLVVDGEVLGGSPVPTATS